MPTGFSHILIPVDFSVNTEVAIARAVDLVQLSDCRITLLHIQRILLPGMVQSIHCYVKGYSRQQVNADRQVLLDKLQALKNKMEERHPALNVRTELIFGEPVQESIVRCAMAREADLIIIGKKGGTRLFPFLHTVVPARIAAASGVAVLTAKPGSLNNEIRTIVVCIGPHSSARKLAMLEALRRKSKMQVRLVSVEETDQDDTHSRQSLFNAFRLLKAYWPYPVAYEVLQGNNKARTLLRYCNKVGADMLIVNSGAETTVSGWTKQQISDLLPASSRTQVLALDPA